ncbi:MAG TPA: hypothetical protein PLP33_24945 [Leptospiraceae bacterium]|nr:hypothetical protein [Leptospiraceae bacterium]
MQNKRYIKILALQIDNELTPFWELNYSNSNMFGEGFSKKDSSTVYYSDLIECIYDCEKKQIKPAVVKDFYPETNSSFKVGESVFREVSHDTYTEDEIIEVFYERYDSEFYTIKKLRELTHYLQIFSEEELNSENIYEIRKWIPCYRMNSGTVIKWDYQLKHKA